MSKQRWSQRVTRSSHALELQPGVFCLEDPGAIARSLWQSSQQSPRKKRTTYGSAMAMLCFYMNRASSRLSPARLQLLTQAKHELRHLRRQHAAASATPLAQPPNATNKPQPSTGTCSA